MNPSIHHSITPRGPIRSVWLLLCLAASMAASQVASALEVLIVAGLEGVEDYREVFHQNIAEWEKACSDGGVPCAVIGKEPSPPGTSVKQQLQQRLASAGKDELWIVLIGHGTFDGRTAKFNIAGDDFTDRELAEWCRHLSGPLTVINTASASAPFLRELAGPKRTIITATKSPNEIYFTYFGAHFARAVAGLPAADLDNDRQVSLLESFLYASHKTEQFYQENGRLATEHALIDDNGDGLGTRSDWFEGVTATRVAKDGAEPDGLRALQQVLVKNESERRFPEALRARRDELERKVRVLRRQKSELEEAAYYRDLEALLRELAAIYAEAEKPKAP